MACIYIRILLQSHNHLDRKVFPGRREVLQGALLAGTALFIEGITIWFAFAAGDIALARAALSN